MYSVIDSRAASSSGSSFPLKKSSAHPCYFAGGNGAGQVQGARSAITYAAVNSTKYRRLTMSTPLSITALLAIQCGYQPFPQFVKNTKALVVPTASRPTVVKSVKLKLRAMRNGYRGSGDATIVHAAALDGGVSGFQSYVFSFSMRKYQRGWHADRVVCRNHRSPTPATYIQRYQDVNDVDVAKI